MKRRGERALLALIITALIASSPQSVLKAYASSECTEASVAPDVKVSSRLLELLLGKKDDGKGASERVMLCPGGEVFGAKIKEDKVTVMEAISGSGIRAGDILLSINGKAVFSVDDVKSCVKAAAGAPLKLTLKRGSEEIYTQITPTKTDDGYMLGISLRDSTAGIGTVTFTDPVSGAFAGLGHGICDAESGRPVELSSGSITGVILGGVKRGECGKPGELCGVLTPDIKGSLYANTECGVFGTVNTARDGKCIPIGRKSAVHAGDAKIISTVKNGKKCEFSVKLFDVDSGSDGTKSFKIKVTDPALIGLTGGIVRGMSGSPIIQDGKLIGAVTHVMVADPTEGYGIFIENMLEASMKSIGKRAA